MKLFLIVILFSTITFAQQTSKEQIKKQIDSLSALLNTAPPDKKEIRLKRITQEIDSLNKVKATSKTMMLAGLGIWAASYFLYPDINEKNISSEDIKSSMNMVYLTGVAGLIMELYGFTLFQETTGKLNNLESKKYDLMEYE